MAAYLDEFLGEHIKHRNPRNHLCWSVFDFVRRTNPEHVQLLHYSGREDLKYPGIIAPIMAPTQVEVWTQDQAKEVGLTTPTWTFPTVFQVTQI